MRLLHVSDLTLESFVDEECPPYAILSHTWGREEISLQELQLPKTYSLLRSAKECLAKEVVCDSLYYTQGCLKIAGCALQAQRDGLDYIWCDTCCIDKTNSTELSEAINSMYDWYKGRLCYVYLADISSKDQAFPNDSKLAFSSSRWFTRGWTLQELIAPSKLVFFDASWRAMGTRSEYRDIIAERTGIHGEVLDGQDPLRFSVANRMSWASQRRTTRVEDLAYCLMGLFGVNMPLIYGEKHKAFFRLQIEIMKVSEDHSLFAWRGPEDMPGWKFEDCIYRCGLLATSPQDFTSSRSFVPSILSHTSEEQPPFSMTSRGVNISLPLIQLRNITNNKGPPGVYLIRDQGRSFRRYFPHRLDFASEVKGSYGKIATNMVYVAQNKGIRKIQAQRAGNVRISELPEDISKHSELLKVFTDPKQQVYHFYIPELAHELSREGVVLDVFTDPAKQHSSWDPVQRRLSFTHGLAAALYLGRPDNRGRMLLIGLDDYLSVKGVFCQGSAFAEGRTMNQVTYQKYKAIGGDTTLATFDRQYWDQLLATFRTRERSSATLDIGAWTKLERTNPKVYQRRFENVYTERRIQIARLELKMLMESR
ncbi:MAG: hypothetical protein L6R41_000398 [Letrouitia leprolyta]|nr:MAG: hypothetical protein L6R41_000398 [Letrouitia leprolyta]